MSKGKSVKTKNESKNYKKAVKSLKGYSNTIDRDYFSNLQGSNEDNYNAEPQSRSPEKPKGLARVKIKQFLKKHIFEEIISVILAVFLAVSSWVVGNLITIREKAAAFEVRIEVAKEKLDAIESDYVSKAFLTQELEILKLKLEGVQKDELSTIETKISLIETEIKYLSEYTQKASGN